MKKLFLSLLLSLPLMFLFVGCRTNDFRAYESVRTGMARDEARAAFTKYGFQLEDSQIRPANGWPSAEGATFGLASSGLPQRARLVEQQLGTNVASADYFPIGHGLFGFSRVFLFYNSDNHLVNFYRHQIN